MGNFIKKTACTECKSLVGGCIGRVLSHVAHKDTMKQVGGFGEALWLTNTILLVTVGNCYDNIDYYTGKLGVGEREGGLQAGRVGQLLSPHFIEGIILLSAASSLRHAGYCR